MRLPPPSRSLPLAVLLLAAPLVASGQASDAIYSRTNALSGFEYRGYTFGPGIGVNSIKQWDIPLVFVAPLGRAMSVDLTSHVTHSSVDGLGGAHSLSGLSDTELRLLYTISRDRLVTSLSLNLPTGHRSVSDSQFPVAEAIGSNYLSFPVANTGTSFGATGGLAYAAVAGSWHLGLAGALRYLGSYKPFSDQATSYKPGVESRLRAGADRLLGGSSRMLLGLTFSTFSTDTYSGASTGSYSPGARLIGDFAVLHVVGRSTVTFAAWDYYRQAGATDTGAVTASKENVLNAELRVAQSVSPRVQIEPFLGLRQWSPANYRGGRLYSGGLAAHYAVNDQLSAHLTARLDHGWIYLPAAGRGDVTGTGLTVLLRYQH